MKKISKVASALSSQGGVSKIATGSSKTDAETAMAASIADTRQQLKQWKEEGTLLPNLHATLRTAFPQRTITPSSHPDVPSSSELQMLEHVQAKSLVTCQSIQDFLSQTASVWDKHCSAALNTWTPSANTFGKNYALSAKVHDPAPLQSFARKFGNQSLVSLPIKSEGSRSGAPDSIARLPTDQDLDELGKQLEQHISTLLDDQDKSEVNES